MRTARIAGLVSLALVGAFLSAVPASAASLGISKFKVAPAYASGGGSSVTFTAKTKNATSCRIKSSPVVKGMPAALSCADGSARKVFRVPANRSSKARKIVFTLIARHGSLHVRAHVTVNQDPALAAITSLTRSPATARVSATPVKISAKVAHAKTCTLSSSPAISGLPASASCTSGVYAKKVTVPANTRSSARTFTFTLAAKNSIGKITKKSVKVSQPGETTPPSVALTPTPAALTAGGGPLTLKTTVAHATSCTLTSSPSVGSLGCANGTANHTVSIPANTSGASKTYTFTLSASGPAGTANTVLSMTQPSQAPAAVMFLTISSSPLSLTADRGSFTVQATLSGASTCSLTSTPDVGHATNVSCSNGTFDTTVTIPANATSSSKPFHFDLSATGEGGSATASLDIDQPAPQVAPPAVTALSSSPATLTAAGGPITVSATLTGGSSCTWSSSPDAGSAASAACSTSSSHQFTVPPNTGSSAITYTFTLDVVGPDGGHASATLTRTQPPVVASGPQVNSITPNPTSLTSAGGALSVSASVANATTCSITSSPDVGSVSDPDCSDGTVSKSDFAIPANTTGSDRPYTFTITANGAGGASATGTLKMTQPAATPPAPQVVNMTTSPSTVDYHGGPFSVTATLTNATSCTLSASGATVTSIATGSCTTGTYTGTVSIPANSGTAANTVTITVAATGPGGSASGTLTFHVPPPPPTATQLQASQNPLPPNGGSVNFSSTLTRASQCVLTSSPNIGGSSGACTTSFSQPLSIPAHTSGATKTYIFTLNVTGLGGTATTSVTLTQAATKP